MCHLNIVHYLFCNHWRNNMARCGFHGHVLCAKKTTDETIHDVCPQCRSFLTRKRLKEVLRCRRQFCEYLRFTKEAPAPDGPRDSRSGEAPDDMTRMLFAGVQILTDVCVDRQRQYSGAEWRAYCPPDDAGPKAIAQHKPAGTITERLSSTSKPSEESRA